jgi:hypothetical protein
MNDNFLAELKTAVQKHIGIKWGKPLLFFLLALAIVRGVVGVFFFEESRLYAFTSLLRAYMPVFLIWLIVKLISRGNKILQNKIWKVLTICLGIFIFIVILFAILLLLNSYFHFWF